jgi:hypothetical protein
MRGVINSALLSLGLIEEPLAFLLYSQAAVVITLPMPGRPLRSCRSMSRWKRSTARCWRRRPIWATARSAVPADHAAAVDAGGHFGHFLIFIPTTGDYITPALIGGPDGAMIGNLIQLAVRCREQLADGGRPVDCPDAVDRRVSVAFLLVTRIVRRGWHERRVLHPAPNRPLQVYAALFLIVLYVPILFLPLFSFNTSIYVRFPLEGFTTQWYRDLFQRDRSLGALCATA